MIEGVNFDIENEQSFTFSTLDNTGVIANNGTSNVTFTPSNAQITQGFIDVVLTLTPPPSANCSQISQTLRVNIQPLASITVDEFTATICENESYLIDGVVVRKSRFKQYFLDC